MSLIDEFRANIPDSKDPIEWILFTRKELAGKKDRESCKQLLAELEEKIGMEGLNKSREVLIKKDGDKQWSNFSEILNESLSLGPRLITAITLEEAVAQYFKYHKHAESCWFQACDCFRSGRYPFSAFFSILALEETGKLSFLWNELLSFQPDNASKTPTVRKKDPLYHHSKKHVIAACQGALVNDRLDRLIGLERVKTFIENAASGELEAIRQGCLYSDYTSNGPSIPLERVSRDDACLLAVISGEIMADVLGNFPWEWERMIKAVKKFEFENGLSTGD
jgi:AbiV family abortive infection protein